MDPKPTKTRSTSKAATEKPAPEKKPSEPKATPKAEPKALPKAEPKAAPKAEPKAVPKAAPKAASKSTADAPVQKKLKTAAAPPPPEEDDDDDDEDDDCLDFDNLTENEDETDETDDDNSEGEFVLCDGDGDDDVFDLDRYKTGSKFDQEKAEKEFLEWKAKRKSKQPISSLASIQVSMADVDEQKFKAARLTMTQRLVESYQKKLQQVEAELKDESISKPARKRLVQLQKQYQDSISARQKELL